MVLQGIDFGPVLGASGMEAFFGEGYSYDKLLQALGVTLDGVTFVAKTTTLLYRKGNMPMRKDGLTPQEIIPRCIKVYFRKAVILNSVGLSGPGAEALFKDGRWQKRKEPFFLSFMSTGETAEDRMTELEVFVEMLKKYFSGFQTRIGLQVNYSCPNVGLQQLELVDEARHALDRILIPGVPIMLKFSVVVPVETVKEICEHPNCDAICVSNTIPWGMLPDEIDWQGLFGTSISPLARLGGGGLSGKPLLPLVAEWLRKAREIGITKPINAGGGILGPNDVYTLQRAGASSIFIGSMIILRPWLVRDTIWRAFRQYYPLTLAMAGKIR